MKQLYLLVAVCLYCTVTTHAQTKYWIGLPTGANWNDPNNWSDNSGSSTPGTTVPNGASYNVVFEQNAIVNVDLAAITLNSLTVTGTNVRLYTAAGASTAITLNSTSTVAPALLVNSGSTLEDSCGGGGATGQSFIVNYANGAQARVNGTWYFTSAPGLPPGISYTELPATTGLGNLLEVNGTIKVSNGGHVQCTVPAYLSFTSTGQFWHNRNAGSVPRATWSTTSTLSITGLQTNGIGQFGLPATALGNVIINCTALTSSTSNTVGLPNGLVINGNIQVLSTNNINLPLGAAGGSSTNNYTVQGDLSISPNSNVTLGGQTATNAYSMQLNGNFIQTGGSFYLRNALAGVNQPTTLHVAGNITQSAGTFGCLNAVINTSTDLFVVELNGTGPGAQTVSLSSGTIDNATNQVALHLNNAAGATLLTPLAVGKISWGTNKGNLTTTTTNVLTVNNPDISDTRVVLGQSDAGYVNGPVRRKTITNTTLYYKFPTGKGGVLRECEVLPSTAAAAEFEAEYFNTAYPGGLAVTAPLTGVSGQEYWDIGRTAGSDPATVRLNLAGAVTGASATDTLVVAHYTGGNWTDVRGTKLTPGNSTTGSVESMLLSSFSPFTFGFTSASTLPIYLLNFTARNDGGVAKLNWTTTENSTPQKFEILRSTDGGSFTQVGTVTGVERKLTYDFTDNALPAGTVYYRLRMVDIDGSAELTKIVAVMNGSKGVLITSMMPTLVTDRARLNITSSEKTTMQLVITDMYGRAIKRQINSITNGNQEVWMNLGALPAGTYQVTGYLSTGEKTSSIRFIKR